MESFLLTFLILILLGLIVFQPIQRKSPYGKAGEHIQKLLRQTAR